MPRVHVEAVAKDLYVLRLDDNETRFFEGLWEIPEGITYNAYVLTTSEGAVVFDTWKGRYGELFAISLREVVDPRDVRYVVIHHMEQDHSGSLPKLLSLVDKGSVALVGFPMVKDMVRAFYGISDVKFVPVRDGDSIELGGYRISFIHVPWLHWPETMVSYIEPLGALLTCDAFGSYSIPPSIFDDGIDDEYLSFVRKYVATVIGFYSSFIVKNIDKLRSLGLDIRIVAPSHGVIWRKDPSKIIDYYYRLAMGDLVNDRKVTIVYSSMYGFVEEAMSRLASRLEASGFEVKLYGFTDSTRASLASAIGDAMDSKFIVLGVSTYERGAFPLMGLFMDLLTKKVRLGNRVVVATCFGWGSPKRIIEEKLSRADLQVIDVIEFRGRASNEVVERIARAIEGS